MGDERKTGIFKLMHPGLFVYHCAAAPAPQHIQNGMFGMILVEPEKPLYVLFNGKEGALVNKALMSKQGDKPYCDADLVNPPARSVQTPLVAAGGVTVVEVNAVVPGTYTHLHPMLWAS